MNNLMRIEPHSQEEVLSVSSNVTRLSNTLGTHTVTPTPTPTPKETPTGNGTVTYLDIDTHKILHTHTVSTTGTIARVGDTPTGTLRHYQVEAIQSLRSAVVSGSKRIILYSPTGSGKTEIALEMVRRALERHRRVLFVCNRLELVSQASRRFYASGMEHGIIQGDNTRDTDSGVLLCSIQTLNSRGYPTADLIIVDEAHACAGTKAYISLLASNIGSVVIGLTATPFSRGLGRHVDDLSGPLFQYMVSAATIRELINLGYLLDCEIYAPGEPDLSKVELNSGEYNQTQLGVAVNTDFLVGDIVDHWIRLANGKSTVCFATNIAHSTHIVESFLRLGITAEHIDAYTSDDDRKGILHRFYCGETIVISNCSVLAEGWDCPSAQCMILAHPTRSLTRYIQMAGRVLRPAPGKTHALILDHSGSCANLGFPTEDLPIFLDDGKRKEKKADEKEEIKPKVCPSCKYVKPKGVVECPKCGFRPVHQIGLNKVESIPGTLMKIKKSDKKIVYTMEEKQQFYSELLGYARSRGYKKGWAYHNYKEKFGVFPHTGIGTEYLDCSEETMKWIKSQWRKKKNAEKR